MTTSELMKAMADAGAPFEAILIAVQALDAKDAEILQRDKEQAEKRARDAERKRNDRAANSHNKRPRNVRGRSKECPSDPPIDNTHTPSVSPNGETDKPVAFPKPDWADVSVWYDFLANRKRKRLPNTATAHKAFLADIARQADAEWPPGRLLEHATAKGWGAIYDPRQQAKLNGTQDGKPTPSNDQTPRNAYVRAVIAKQAARSADERRQPDSWAERSEAAF